MKGAKEVDVFFTPIDADECKAVVLSPLGEAKAPARKMKKKRRARDGSFAGSGNKAPSARGGSTLTAVGSKLYLIGGASPDGVCSEGVVTFDLETKRWSSSKKAGGEAPSGMTGHSAVAFGDAVYVFGGIKTTSHDFESFDDVFILDTKAFAWTKAKTEGPKPSPRNSHTATLVKLDTAVAGTSFEAGDTLMVVVGGSCPMSGPKGDVYALKLNGGGGGAGGVLRWERLKVGL